MLTFEPCTPEHLQPLLKMATEIFDATFAPLNTPENMRAYMDVAFTEEQFLRQLREPESRFFFACEGGERVGYFKVNVGGAQTELQGPDAMELERIYAYARYHGCGCGQQMLDKAIELAREAGKAYIWLGVWEKNARARKFYEKNGFVQFSSHTFVMGDDPQTDYLLRREL